MKTYLDTIRILQRLLLGLSVLILLTLPLIIVFKQDGLSDNTTLRLYDIAHITVLFVMIIRPLADIFRKTNLIRPLVILRKGVGVLSASIITSFILAKIIIVGGGYFASWFTAKYWSFENYAILAHLADLSAIILIITSNNLSKKILGDWWKRVQKLAYIYYYASSFYVYLVFGTKMVAISIIIVTLLTLIAFYKNWQKRKMEKISITTQAI
jgi:DMSO/TMAO reductase YedYZ heme-binding membrane subunit